MTSPINKKRRQFLSDCQRFSVATAGFYGLENLLGILFQRQIAGAAEAVSTSSYKYVNFLTPGAPPRWFFDQPLNPQNMGALFTPGGFGTEIIQVGSKWQPVYKTYKQTFGGKDIYLPPVWNLKSASGEKFSSLLKEMIMVRGVNMEINAHQTNQQRTVRPFVSSPSITGLIGDASLSPAAAIGYSRSATTNAFKSFGASTGIGVNVMSPISELVLPFDVKKVVKKDDLKFSIQQALRLIDTYASENQLISSGAETNLGKAYDMFARKIDSYQTSYAQILNKYNDIVTAEYNEEIPSVSERSLLNAMKTNSEPQFSITNTRSLSGDNLKSIYQKATMTADIARAFAFCEFALLEDLTSALTLDFGLLIANDIKNTPFACDQHYAGAINSIIFTSTYFRCILGCMLELRKTLIHKNLYDKTLFHFASEFSRTPRTDMGGSDHGFNSAATSFISGMITESGSGLVGNIYKDSNDPVGYKGTWGLSAPIQLASGKRQIINDDVVSSVCEIMKVQKIGTKGQSLVRNVEGRVSLITKEGNNVAS